MASSLPPPGLEEGLTSAQALESQNPLVLQVAEALRICLVDASPTVANGLEMKHVLLLLVKLFHELCQEMVWQRAEWLARMRSTIDQQGKKPFTTRDWTGRTVVQQFEGAPWGLWKEEGATRSNTAHTILAVYAGMVRFIKQLEIELAAKEREGVNLKDFDVEENQSEPDDERMDATPSSRPATRKRTAGPKLTLKPPKRQKTSTTTNTATKQPAAKQPATRTPKSRATSTNRSTTPSGRTNKNGTRPGNYNHETYETWSKAEFIGILKVYRDNDDKTHKQIAELHNAAFWPQGNTKRSTDAVRQQYQKLMGRGPREESKHGIASKLAELEGSGSSGDDADGEDENEE